MTDPFSIATGCVALIGTIAKVSLSITSFVKSVRSARSDLDTISRELLSLQTVLELLADDTSTDTNNVFPDSLRKQVSGIVANCSQVLEEIQRTLEKYDRLGTRKTSEWVISGAADVQKLRLSLEAHKSALEIALDMVQLSISREIKTDTTEIRSDTTIIKQDTAQILIQISELRAQLPQDVRDPGTNVMLERYLNNLTTYAESVRSDDPEKYANQESPLGPEIEEGDGSFPMSPTAAAGGSSVSQPVEQSCSPVEAPESTERRSRRRLSMPSMRRSLSQTRQPAVAETSDISANEETTEGPERFHRRRLSMSSIRRSLSQTGRPQTADASEVSGATGARETADISVGKQSTTDSDAAVPRRQAFSVRRRPSPATRTVSAAAEMNPEKHSRIPKRAQNTAVTGDSSTSTKSHLRLGLSSIGDWLARSNTKAPLANSSAGSAVHSPSRVERQQATDSRAQQSSSTQRLLREDSVSTPTLSVGNEGTEPASKERAMISDSYGVAWMIGKTIGGGSVAKVKLAKSAVTGELVALKILPREKPVEEPLARQRRAQRPTREVAMLKLLNHPNICSMHDVVRTGTHWYLFLEYISGGNLLDYIVFHGRLREKFARKFSRQIASALDYCHKNNIVHRDIKIENILVTKTRDIKLIDFLLSSPFSPDRHLSTFCGSLYYCAPELLESKPYVGPEIDVWSFGVVLYVLVCGRVPFDNKSELGLRDLIKSAAIELPSWLSSDCKNLLSRMLTKQPALRASLSEVMNHPWMMKGYSSSGEISFPNRVPLRLPLDQEVIEDMSNLDFGTAAEIKTKLEQAIQSSENQGPVIRHDNKGDSETSGPDSKKPGSGGDKRRSGSHTSLPDAVLTAAAPREAVDPMVSIYHLVCEKRERR